MYNVFGFLVLILLIVLPVAIIKPSLFTKITKGLVTNRKRALGVFGGGLISSFLLFGITVPDNLKNEAEVKGDSIAIGASIQPSEQPGFNPEPTPMTSPSPSPSLSPSPSPSIKPASTSLKPSVRPSATPTPKPTETPAPTAPAVGSSNSGSKPTSGGDKDCSDFSTEAEAQAYFLSKGGSPSNNVDRLDADHDGKACESL